MNKTGGVYQVDNVLKGAGGVRFPSDSLSAKEKRALNGVCITYDMSTFDKPTTWEILQSWPKDIQRDYLKKCYWTHDGTTDRIAEMLGCCKRSVYLAMKDLCVPLRQRGYRADKEKWQAFLKSAVTATISDTIPEETAKKMMDMVAEPEEMAAEAVTPVDETVKAEEPKKEQPAGNSILALAALLEQFKGTGTRLTLEMVL